MIFRDEVNVREERIEALVLLYQNAYTRIITEIVDATESGKIRKARTMVAINQILEGLGVDVEKWVKKEIPQYYLEGANDALQQLKELGIDVKAGGMTAINREAIAAFVDDTMTAFAESIRGVSRSARLELSNALKQQINLEIATGKLTGETRKSIAANVKQRLQEAGLTALVDRGGRKWKLDEYADMLVRTRAVEARNTGLANRMLRNGYDLVQVSNTGTKHPACARWQGKILSISGLTPVGSDVGGGFTVAGTLDQAKNKGLFHPNCKHAINAIHPELAAKTTAYDNPYNRMTDEEKSAADKAFLERDKKT